MELADNLNMAVIQIREWQQRIVELNGNLTLLSPHNRPVNPTTIFRHLEGVVVDLNGDISEAHSKMYQLYQKASDIEYYATLSIEDREEVKRAYEAQIARLREEMKEMGDAIDQSRLTTAAKDTTISQLFGALQDDSDRHAFMTLRLQILQDEKAEMERGMCAQRDFIADRDVQVSTQQRELLSKDRRITRLRQEVAVMEAVITDKDTQILDLQGQFRGVVTELYISCAQKEGTIFSLLSQLSQEMNVTFRLQNEIDSLKALTRHILHCLRLATTFRNGQQQHLQIAYVEEVETADLWIRRFTKAPVTVDGVMFTEKACLEKSLSLDKSNAKAWKNLARICRTYPAVFNNMEFTSQDCYVEALKIDSNDYSSWYELGELLKSVPSFKNDNAVYDRKKCLAKCLELEPNTPDLWMELYKELPPTHPGTYKEALFKVGDERLSDIDCKEKSQRIYEKKIESCVDDPDLWYQLFLTLPVNGVAVISHETFHADVCKRIARALYVGRLASSPLNATLWFKLFKTLPDGEVVAVNGETFTPLQCIVRAAVVSNSPDKSKLWAAMHFKMATEETICPMGVRTLNRYDCWHAARADDPLSPETDSEFGLDEKQKEIRQLVAKVQDDPSDHIAWHNLFKAMPSGGVVRVGDKLRSEHDCRIEATRLCISKLENEDSSAVESGEDEEDIIASLWSDLYTLIPTDGIVQVKGQVVVDKVQCLSNYLDTYPERSTIWHMLSRLINFNQSVTILDKTYTREQCIERALKTGLTEGTTTTTGGVVLNRLADSLMEGAPVPFNSPPHVWYNLYNRLPSGSSITVDEIRGTQLLLSAEDCLRRAQKMVIEALETRDDDPLQVRRSKAVLWAQLSTMYPPHTSFTVNGELVEGRGCLRKALQADVDHLGNHPDDVDAWTRVLEMLPDKSKYLRVNPINRLPQEQEYAQRLDSTYTLVTKRDPFTDASPLASVALYREKLIANFVCADPPPPLNLPSHNFKGTPAVADKRVVFYSRIESPTTILSQEEKDLPPPLSYIVRQLQSDPRHLIAWFLLQGDQDPPLLLPNTIIVNGKGFSKSDCSREVIMNPYAKPNSLSNYFKYSDVDAGDNDG